MNEITDFDRQIRDMFEKSKPSDRSLMLIALAIGMSRLILSKFSYWLTGEVSDNGKD